MGSYLHIGFVAKATAELPKGITIEQVNESLADFYPLNTFDCKVLKNKITWTLRPDVIQAELAEFAETFYEDYHGDADGHRVKKTLNFIRVIADSSNWFEQATEEEEDNFSVSDFGCAERFAMPNESQIRIDTTTITLGSEGKFMMEDDECTLRFLETAAQKAFSDFKLGKTLRAYVY